MLSVRDERRSRSKSPSGRDRDRSRSRDEREPAKKERRSSKYSPSGSENESADDRRRYKEKRSSKKQYDDGSDDDRRRGHKSSKKHADDDSEESDRYRTSRSSKSYRDQSVSGDDRDRRRDKDRREKKKSDESDSERRSSKKDRSSKQKHRDSESSESEGDTRHRRSKKESDRNGYPQYPPPPQGYPPGYGTNYPPPPGAYQDTRHMSYVPNDPRFAPPGGYMPAPGVPQRGGSVSAPRYAEPDRSQYGQPDPTIYKVAVDGGEKQYIKTYNSKGEPQLIEIKGEYERKRPEKDKTHAEDKHDRRDKEDRDGHKKERTDKKYHEDKYSSSPDDATRKMSRLAVGGGALGAATLGVAAAHGSHDGGKPPASPLLEAYRGTYQSISPMPSALVLSKGGHDSDLSDLELDSDDSADSNDPNADLKRKIKKLEKEKAAHQKSKSKSKSKAGGGESDDDHHRSRQNSTVVSPRSSDQNVSLETRQPRGRVASDASIISPASGGRRRVMFYDATSDAKKLAEALEGTHRPPQIKPLVEILPGLSDDDIMALRLEYKTFAKVGGQGINLAKHIKMRVQGNLGKACYATALGRWESEAYWANSWYQGGATRRELLIESLMGRSNSDIREIKNCFKDKRYNDDLERCMKAELKADKFRTVILLALEERRLPESSPLDIQLVREDVQDLHRALTSPGGETAMINIIVVRSDQHLREVLKVFEKAYKVNFARAMIDKSRNLVGETLAHVLNGALNRPMRDALLLHQAISETAPSKERAELLVSRLVRLHWEPKHLEKVKAQYEARYRVPVEIAIRQEVMAQMKTEEGRGWAEFCVQLVRSSM